MKKVLALLLALAPSFALAQNAGWPPPAGAVAFLGVYNTVLPTVTNGQVNFLQTDNHGHLLIVCASGCSGGGGGGGTSYGDEAAYTAGSDSYNPFGGVYWSSIPALTNGQGGTAAMTANRDVHIDAVAGTNLANLIAAAVPGFYATAYNTCSQVTGTTAPICVDLNGNMYANISRYMGTAGTANTSVMSVQGIASMTPLLVNPGTAANWGVGATGSAVPANAQYIGIVSGGNLTGWTGAVTVGSGGIASGAIASGAVASGAIASGAVASGAYASGAISDGANVTLGSKADAKSTATDTTAITLMQVDKEISFAAQNPMTASAINPTSTLTLPSTTTAYSAGTLICTSATVGTCNTALSSQTLAIGNSAGGAKISRLRLTTNDATSTAWGAQTIQIDLWSAAPTFATTGDRGAFNTDFATGSAGHLGAFICVMSAELADGAYSECYPTIGNYALPKLASGTSIFWTAQAVTGSGTTGASKVFTLTAEMSN